MAVANVRRLLGWPRELCGLHERCVWAKRLGGGFLGLANREHIVAGLGATVAEFTDDNRQIWLPKFPAHILDEID